LSDYSNLIAGLVTKACIRCLPREKSNFDSEYVRVTKILGGSVLDSHVLSGLIVTRNVEGNINRLENPKICVFNAPLDPQS
jgi:T-complex protein 1 subunit theta